MQLHLKMTANYAPSLITTIVTSYILRIKKVTRNGQVESFEPQGVYKN